MMQILEPTYTLRVIVQDRMQIGGPIARGRFISGRQFFDGDQTGCDEVLSKVREAIRAAGISSFSVALERFELASVIAQPLNAQAS